MQHLSFTLSIILFFLGKYQFNWEASVIDEKTFFYPVIVIITRSFIIGVRYGFMSNLRWRLVNKKQKISYLSGDFLLGSWNNLKIPVYNEEYDAAVKRNNFEPENL